MKENKEETQLRSAEEILKEKLKNIHFIRSDETYALVIEAMTEYAAQFKPSVFVKTEFEACRIRPKRFWIKTRKK